MLKRAAAAVFLSLLALTSCWQDFNDAFIGTSASSPPEVTFAASLMTSSSVTLNWTEPDAVTYSGTRITCTGNGSTTEITLAKGTTTYTASGLTGGVKYTFTVYATYSSGYESAGAAFTITPMDKTLRFTYTAEQLSDVRNGGLGDYCVLMADVDLSGYSSGTGWSPIGTSSGSAFTGIFDGNGHTISNLTINDSTTDYKGLFGYTSGAEIKNVTLTNVSVNGKRYVGGLAGYSTAAGNISNCSVSGTVSGGNDSVGGMVGIKNGGTVENCTASVTVNSTSESAGGLIGHCQANVKNCHATGSVKGTSSVGGLVGYASGIQIEQCFATGNVIIDKNLPNPAYAGGLVGMANTVTITKCYALGDVTVQYPGTNFVYAGSLAGYFQGGTIQYCFARGNVDANNTNTGPTSNVFAGGLVGRLLIAAQHCYSTGSVAASKAGTCTVYINGFANTSASHTACYYNTDTTGRTDTGTGYTYLTTSQMMDSANYSGWNFSTVWSISPSINGGYPYLTGMAP
jgi:hypothetical protein